MQATPSPVAAAATRPVSAATVAPVEMAAATAAASQNTYSVRLSLPLLNNRGQGDVTSVLPIATAGSTGISSHQIEANTPVRLRPHNDSQQSKSHIH